MEAATPCRDCQSRLALYLFIRRGGIEKAERVPKNDAKQSTNFSDDSHKMTEMETGYMPHVRVETKSASLYRYYRIKYIRFDSIKP